jgi:hypothetical protein
MPMLTFLFWNLGEQPLQVIVGNLARLHQVDVLILAECTIPEADLLRELNRDNPNTQKTGFRPPDPDSLCERIVIYPRFPGRHLRRKEESEKYTCRILKAPGHEEILLFALHFASKRFRSDESQSLSVPGFSRIIREQERTAGHERTLLVGDFNMNPYELGLVGAEGLNAVMTREIARRGSRMVDGIEYPFFYNPMWGLFGDAKHEHHPPGNPEHQPAGTCYYPSAESRWYFWNMFDQVLLRPALIPCFRHAELRILVTDGSTVFLNRRGIPRRRQVSDHLPLLFRLHL